MVMKVEFTGSTLDLKHLAAKLRKAGSPQVLGEFSHVLGEECIELVVEGFQDEESPYGDKWPNKVFGDGRQVLVGKTGNLRRRWNITHSDSTSVTISPRASSTAYAGYHQTGTGIYGPHKQRIEAKNYKALGFFAEGYVTIAAAARVRAQAGNAAVKKMKGSTLYFRSVKGAPARKMFPDTAKLPPKWQSALDETTREFWEIYFRERG